MHRCHLVFQALTRTLCDWRLAAILLSLLISGSGCKQETKGGPRVEVVPITGKVLVDGKPREGVFIFFNRTSDRGVDFAVPDPEGVTDKDGVISATTYHIGDGGPPGDYTLTFEWSEENEFTGDYGPDKLKGKYTSMENSEHKVTIPESGDGNFDIGTIELSTQ